MADRTGQNGYFYRGESMFPTFRQGDYLFYQKIPCRELRCGDTIIFLYPDPEDPKKQCAHRIVSRSRQGIRTRGDNNPKQDDEPMLEEALIGRVTRYERNGKTQRACNGGLGRLRAWVLHGRRHILRSARFFLRKPYRLLKASGLVARFWRPEIERVRFETQNGPLIKYVRKGRTVASCWVDNQRWRFRRPYDFVIRPGSIK